ncbi:MAG TPA: hypothetical protein VGJ16_02140 [Pirellulales bacterium]|jgi:hypothetical protein
MNAPKSKSPQCPRCASKNLTLCGRSVEYAPEQWPGQPLKQREVATMAYQCECGMAFTHTVPSQRDKKRERE